MSAADAPAAAARDPAIDALRALALFGILFINIDLFAWSETTPMVVRPDFTGAADRIAQALVVAFAGGKFLTIFAFVFGWSAFLQMRSGGGPDRFIRRLAAFAVIGAAHFALIYFGDIVFSYAVAGLFLLRSRGWDDRRLARNAAIWLAAVAGISILLAAMAAIGGDAAEPAGELARRRLVFAEGGWAAILREHLAEAYQYTWLLLYQAAVAAPFARFGYLAARRAAAGEASGRAAGAAAMRAALAPWAAPFLAAGLAINGIAGLVVLLSGSVALRSIVVTLAIATGGFLFALVYARGALAFLLDPRRARWRDRLAVLGRMSLSAYVAQSLVASWFFYGYGLGLHGRLGPAAVTGIAVLVNAIVFAAALAWGRAFGQGPLERLVALAGGHRRETAAGSRP